MDTKISLITGVNGFLGRSVAKLCVNLGCRTFGVSRAKSNQTGLPIEYFSFDLSVAEQAEILASKIGSKGKISCLICCAGGIKELQASTRPYEAMLKTNFLSTVYSCESLVPHMRDDASVIIVGSAARYENRLGKISPYNCSKAAVCQYAKELQEKNPSIKVRLMEPGGIISTGAPQKNETHIDTIISDIQKIVED